MSTIYTIKKSKIIVYSIVSLIPILCLIVVAYYDDSTVSDILSTSKWAIFFILLISIPEYILYRHYQYDKNTVIEIDNDNGTFKYTRKDNIKFFHFEEIESIDYYVWRWGGFGYYQIQPKNDNYFSVTSFLGDFTKGLQEKIDQEIFTEFWPVPNDW